MLVADTGFGIPRKQQKVIFSPFKQQEGQSTRKYGGTGLGLTISKRLVEDNVLNCQVFKGYLEKYPFDIREAHNGYMALDLLNVFTPDIIFMDLRLPGMNGNDLTREIKKNKKLDKIPVIALSASMIKNYSENEHALFDDTLLKPITKADLTKKLVKFIKYRELKAKKNDDKKSVKTIGENGYIFSATRVKKQLILLNKQKYNVENIKNILSEQVEFIEIEISDNGTGMEPKKVNTIFSLEKKTNSKGTSGEAGSGLGLILCKEFVEKNGGKIRIESKPNNGSSFYFTVPAHQMQ